MCRKLGKPRKRPEESSEKDNPINPSHYKGDTVMRIIEDFSLNFRIGNVVKYCLRAKEKNGVEDLKKALWYLQREIQQTEVKDTSNG